LSTRAKIFLEVPDFTTSEAKLAEILTEESSLDISQRGIHSKHNDSESMNKCKHYATTQDNCSNSNAVSKGQLKSIFSGSHLQESAPDEGVEVSLEVSLASTVN